MENPELISTTLGIVPGAIATLGIFLEKRRMVLATVGAATLITAANIALSIFTNETTNLTGAMIGLTLPVIAAGIKGRSANTDSTNG